ncbi:cilia- and flagella-associated protein 57 [Nephila pilipes]|uniref:Cilia- and flagella-associated protein 57 n=1 Tax=Nephila pilipes TaxID=299642 RepID=A0A8X6PD36_NEPPI|nr:cilia- and flagella-associated protein 57 [Nephila pilipes]
MDLYYSFGVSSNLVRNMTFYDDKTLILVTGKVYVLFHLRTLDQRVIEVVENCEVTALSRCEKHLILAVRDRPASVYLFNIESSTKKLFRGPIRMKSDVYLCVSASTNLKFVAAQGCEPDWLLVIWLSITREVVAVLNPTSERPACVVHDISFNAGEREELVVIGKNVFRLYECQDQEKSESINFSEVIFEKHEEGHEYFSIAWPQKENLAVGNSKGEILFFRGIDLVHKISVLDMLPNTSLNDSMRVSSDYQAVTCLGCTHNELLCVFAGSTLVIYKGEALSQYAFSRCVYISSPKLKLTFPGELIGLRDFIMWFDLSPDNRLICATTAYGQLLYLDLKKDEENNSFKILLPRQHNGPIIAMDVARGRPLVATCSEQSVILWNYETKEQELIMNFKDPVLGLAIHPSGLYLALGFSFYVRICIILYNKLLDCKMLNSKDFSRMTFSCGGHLLAVASHTRIEVYDFLTLVRLAKLEGHAGRISSLMWKDDDTRLISSDLRGIICEWDVISWCKLWENTAVTSYSCLDVVSNKNAVLAIGSDKILKCISDGTVQWEFEYSNRLNVIAVCSDGTFVYTGAGDGSLGKISLPSLDVWFNVFAHSGEITEMVFNSTNRILFTVSRDGLLFAWKTGMSIENIVETTYGNSVFTSVFDLSGQKQKVELLQMSMKQSAIAYECDMKLDMLKHEREMRNMLIDHELVVKGLNKKIAVLKEEIEILFFDSYFPELLKNLEDTNRQTMFDHAEELNAAYERTSAYIQETQEMIKKHEEVLGATEKDYTETWAYELNKEEEILTRIKNLEHSILLEQVTSIKEKEAFERDKRRVQEESAAQKALFKETEKVRIENDRRELELLEKETKKLRHMTVLMREDAWRKRKIASGEVDHDISEKLISIDVLRKGFLSLEDKLKAKQKIALNQDVKYFELRKNVGNLQRSHAISRNIVERLQSNIEKVVSEMKSVQKEVGKVKDSIPVVEEKIRLTSEYCTTLDKKLRETIDGFRDKRSLLLDNENILSRYKSLLHESLSQTCDAVELRKNILHLFDQIKSDVDETLNPNLKAEFSRQIEALRDTYRYIRSDPNKTTKQQSMAEFKLSQENSKLLTEVHEIQKEQQSLRDTIFQMEVAMGMPHTRLAKITKKVDELRDKIEFVVSALSKNREEKAKEIVRLDALLEEQQSEIRRLQSEIKKKEEQ